LYCTSYLSSSLKGILVYLLLLVAYSCYSQASINYSIAQGLPSNEVYDIYQDSEGFLWFATDNGVVRYDGSELKILHVKDGLTDPVVFSFYEDFKKRIWFRTYSGRLSYFDPQKKKIIPYQFNDKFVASVKTSSIISISLDKSDNLWISITGYIIKIDKSGNVFRNELPLKSFIYQDLEYGHLLGLNPKKETIETAIINGTTFPIKLSDIYLAHHVVCSISKNGKLLFSMGRDLFEYSDRKVKKVFTGKAIIISLSRGKNEDIWIGYLNNGVEIVNTNSFKTEYFKFFRKNSISKVLEDTEHGYWFSTLENGVYYLPNKDIDTLYFPKKAKIKSVTYHNNAIITGDQKGYLHFFDTKLKKETSSLFMGAPIMSVFQDIENKLWVSTNNEIVLLDSLCKVQKRIEHISKIDFSNDGSKYVWGTGALNTWFGIDGKIIKSFKTGAYRSILVKDSLLVLAGKIGIEIRNRNSEIISLSNELKNTKIRKIDHFNDTTLLLSSIGNGPILLDMNRFHPEWLNVSKKFPANNIYASVHKDSVLWLGTENGIFKVKANSLLKKTISYEHLTSQSGLLNDKTDFLVSVDKDIWAFSDEGISIIPFGNTTYENQKPKFYIKDLYVNNKRIEINKNITLSHEENYLRLHVGFISFNNRNIRIRFRLSDHDDWSYTSNHSIEFFSLGSGNYKINLEYSTNNIVWIPAIKDLHIDIKSPWWKLWYIQSLILLVITLWVIFFIMTRVSLIKQKQIYLQSETDHQRELIQFQIESIEKERSRIAKDLHDGIGTTLTSIKMRINQVLVKYNQPEADTIENRLQDVLREVKNIIYDLTPPTLMQFGLHEGLKNYIEKIATDTHIQIKLNIFGEEIKQPKINLFIFRITQELVVNSLKHSNAKNINIHLSTFDDLLNILYEDDGNGFMSDEVSRGHGLYNIESRIQSLNGKILFETSAKGVSYSIDIPLLKENSEPNKDPLL